MGPDRRLHSVPTLELMRPSPEGINMMEDLKQKASNGHTQPSCAPGRGGCGCSHFAFTTKGIDRFHRMNGEQKVKNLPVWQGLPGGFLSAGRPPARVPETVG
jgi:hypothetical protein